jgi:hypothetical protein
VPITQADANKRSQTTLRLALKSTDGLLIELDRR